MSTGSPAGEPSPRLAPANGARGAELTSGEGSGAAHHGQAALAATGRAGALRWILILFLLAAGLRVGWVVKRYAPPGQAEKLEFPDEVAYVQVADSLARGQGLVDEFGYRATYMPGYPAFLAVFRGISRPLLWSRIVQAVLAAWVAPATFLLARRFVAGVLNAGGTKAEGGQDAHPPESGAAGKGVRVVAVLAGLGAAFDPFLVFSSGLLLTEALFAAVLVMAWFFVFPMGLKRGRGASRISGAPAFLFAALFLWLGIMLRPSAVVLVILAPVVVVVLRRFERGAMVSAVVMVGLVLAGLLPWAARNRAVIGEWKWLSTRGGISLYDGLQPNASGESNLAHTKEMREVQGLNEVEWDRYFHAQAMKTIRDEPGRVLWLAGRKFLRTWSLTPNVEAYRAGLAAMVSAVWMVCVLATAAVGFWRSRRAVGEWILLLLPVVAFTLLHMVYVGSVRYRAPLMPFVVVLSAMGLWTVLARAAGREFR